MGLITRGENNSLKNRINAQINKAKNDYHKNAFILHKKNMRKSWNLLKNLMGTNSSKKEITSLLNGNSEITDTNEITEIFSDFFSNVGTDLDANLQQSDVSPYRHINRNPYSFHLFPVTPEECLKVIANLKVTYTDINHIPVKIFKSIKLHILYPIVNIINSSFSHGKFPKIMKLAKITPVFKKGDEKICSNYRPISSLPFLSKIYERCMTNRIVSFFNKHSLFSRNQFGFLKNKSTKDAIHEFLENIYDSLNARCYNISILIDLKSAFDTVNHKILLNKLELYGIRGHGLAWIKSYLENREFQVAINNKFSTKRTLNTGIPQGSILGPILFIIYNNDLPMVSDKLSTTLYADDTNFSITDSDYNTMISSLNSELVKVHEWTLANRLTINTSKTEMLLFSNHRSAITCDEVITLDGDRVGWVDYARFLGVRIDNKLNFKIHINHVLGKVAKHGGILFKIKANLPINTRINYYNAFILPYLDFNILHWGKTNASHLEPLEIVQKRIIRTIADEDYLAHTTPIFFRLKLLKIKDLHRFQAVVDTFCRIKEGQYSVSHDLQTRNNQLALPKFHSLTRTQQSVTFYGPTYWNELPAELRNISTLSNFKLKVKDFYLSRYT